MNTEGCRPFQELLMDVLYDAADAAAQARWESHALRCAACRDELATLRGVRGKLAAARPAVPDAAAPPVLILRPRVPPLQRAALLAAAAALFAVALLSLARQELVPKPASPGASAGALTMSAREAIVRTTVTEIQERNAEDLSMMVAALRSELDRRDAAWRKAQQVILTGLVEELDMRRQHDLRYMMSQLGSLEMRAGQEVARTNQRLELAMLGRNPRVEEER